MRGVFLDDDTVGTADLDLSGLRGVLSDWHFAGMTPADRVRESVHEADVVIVNKVVLDHAALAGARRLKLVCVAATGTDNIDLQATGRLGITVCNVRDYATASVVEHVFMVLLALARRLQEHIAAVQRGDWASSTTFSLLGYPFVELAGRTLGIIGYGTLGRAVAGMARTLGMHVLVAQRPGGAAQAGRCPLDELLAAADIVSLHCPLTDTTRHLIGARQLSSMRRSALLINTARGAVVDECALAEALRNGAIAGAAVDVLSEEPPPPHHPLLDAGIPNLIVTPHVAWAGVRSRQALVDGLAANIRAFLNGTPVNVVDAGS
jgi:glycerate dehydrogenase